MIRQYPEIPDLFPVIATVWARNIPHNIPLHYGQQVNILCKSGTEVGSKFVVDHYCKVQIVSDMDDITDDASRLEHCVFHIPTAWLWVDAMGYNKGTAYTIRNAIQSPNLGALYGAQHA